MLIQFNFKNYRSVKNGVSLDMSATSAREHSYNLIETASKEKYLKVAALYGANASGKSNILNAFQFMRYFVLNSLSIERDSDSTDKDDTDIPISSFIFDKSAQNSSSEFEVFFIYNNVEYQYGFSLDKKKIHAEWLYSKSLRKKQFDILFERTGNKVTCGEKLISAEKFSDSIEDQTLFLSLTSKTKIIPSKKVREWFKNSIVIDFGDIVLESLISSIISPEAIENEHYKGKLEEFLSAIDTGIKGIRIEKVKEPNKQKRQCTIYSQHLTKDSGKYIEIPFSEESSGTKKMFCLFDFIWTSMNSGNVLFIDELNAKLHPLLTRFIVNMFHDSSINKNNAQLIFTTHDTYILTKDIFRRDEVWFVEKDTNGVSNLYSLAEYKLDDDSKVRNDATYNKDYLAGRYGAIPLLKEFHIMEG